jgi:hypothetical protein
MTMAQADAWHASLGTPPGNLPARPHKVQLRPSHLRHLDVKNASWKNLDVGQLPYWKDATNSANWSWYPELQSHNIVLKVYMRPPKLYCTSGMTKKDQEKDPNHLNQKLMKNHMRRLQEHQDKGWEPIHAENHRRDAIWNH